MSSKLLILCILVLGLSILTAAPLRNAPLTFTQPDGSTINVFASGDEFHNWLHDADGYSIIKNDSNGWYTYATQDGESVKSSSFLVGKDNPAAKGLSPNINLSKRLIDQKYRKYENSMRDYSNGKSPHTGQFNNIVVFIRFADDPPFSNDLNYYDEMFNATGDHVNSMKTYFTEASYNQLNVDSFFFPADNNGVIVTYIDSQPRNYYRPVSQGNPIGYNPNDDNERTMREQGMLANCIAAVGPQIPTTIDVDGDDDGKVDNVCFIIQGSSDAWAELLWPHRWVLYYANATIHGAQVWDFNFQLETFMFSSGASVLCHEMFHSLGAPDLYRYNDTTITPIGDWDLMAGNANPPQHMSAWMKYKYGQWLPTIPQITESGTYTLSPVAGSATNNFYRIPSWRANEYYVLEYRKGSGTYDYNLPNNGLLVYRLDTRLNGNASGPPDELYIYRPMSSNTTTNGAINMANFSLQSGRTKLNESTIPNGFTGSNNTGGLNLYNVGFAGDTISFSIMISDIQLTNPVGREYWFAGGSKEIKWKAKTTTGNVKLEYSINNGQNWITLVESTPNDGSWIWDNIPNATTTQGLVRVTLLSNSHTGICLEPFAILNSVASPAPVYPTNGAVNVITNPDISWAPAIGAASYHFQLSTSSTFNSFIVNDLEHADNVYSISTLAAFTTYYWRVESVSELGYSDFCPTQSFTTGEITVLPINPTLLDPANGAVNQPLNVLIRWYPTVLAASYHLEVASDYFFTEGLMVFQGITATQFRMNDLSPNTSYYWRVRGMNAAGIGNFSLIRKFTTGSSVPNEDNLNPVLINLLDQNYPNPFNPSTTISFQLKSLNQAVKLNIFNTKGQLVKTLFDANNDRNQYSITWDGRDNSGNAVSSGIYYYKLDATEYHSLRKMLLIK
ncbi:MAG: hypothetical protein CVU48_10760 [Candidatus Cloacimonetes bacterium HGW-Cloacimonetes-1]|jgi:M6 family metalloprotease-like protein|nr:MAG: hypothetical protein CVU48_10760 [Candidatus Cloacimonetes bacterium HGW-Cloacimonetes-1]